MLCKLNGAFLKGKEAELRKLKAEVAALRKKERELTRLAYLDHLTHLGNTRMSELMLDNGVSRYDRDGSGICVLVADVDNLKKANDTGGHQRGDMLLKKAASIMKDMVRKYDVVCRTGGDEFTIIMEGATIGDSLMLAHRMANRCAANGVEISIGAASIAEVYSDGKDAATIAAKMVALADRRMYAAKAHRKNVRRR